MPDLAKNGKITRYYYYKPRKPVKEPFQISAWHIVFTIYMLLSIAAAYRLLVK